MAKKGTLQDTGPARILSIDRFRGICVFCMCFFTCVGAFPVLGLLSRIADSNHAERIMLLKNMALADIIAPSFIFIISLTYQRSFERRYAKSGKSAYTHILLRYMCLMGMGSIMVSAEYIFVDHKADPFLIQTVLMYAALVFVVLSIAAKLIKKTPERVKKIVFGGFAVSLCVLGVMGLALGIYDDVIVFLLGRESETFKHWSILHQIGLTGLLCLPFVRMNWKGKLVSWVVLCAAYTALQQIPGMLEKFDVVVLGGVLGTVGFLIVLLGGLVLMELYYLDTRTSKFYIVMTLVLGALAWLGIKFLPMRVGSVSSNYMVFVLFIDAVLFALISLINPWQPKFQFFVWWGRNPLILYGIELIFRGGQKIWNPSADTGLIPALAFTVGSIGLLTVIAYLLYRNKTVLKL